MENTEKVSRVLKMIHEGYVVFVNLGICSLEEANNKIRQAEINSGQETRNLTSCVILSADNPENVSNRDIYTILQMIVFGQPCVTYTLENYEKILRTETDIYGDTRTYNEEGQCIHFVSSDGKTEWEKEFSGLYPIHYKNNEGYEVWYNYDDKGNLIYTKDNRGYECWRTIRETNDQNGYNYSIHFRDTNGLDRLEEYDRKGYLTHYKNAQTGIEYWYDSTDKQITKD